MTPFLRCNDPILVRRLLSNPVPASQSNGCMTVVCGSVAHEWPVVRGDASDKQKPMETA